MYRNLHTKFSHPLAITIAMVVLSSLIAFPVNAQSVRPASSPDAEATKVAPTRVRIGWFESPFNTLDSMGNRSGYSYEYSRRIAATTGWEYEYVNDSWPNLFEMLLRGEIDILSDVTYTPERAEKLLFSRNEMGKEEFYIIADLAHPTIRPGDPETLQGMRIGVNQHSVQAELLYAWLKKNHIEAEVIESAIEEDGYIQQLQTGELDAVAAMKVINNLGDHRCVSIARLGTCPIQFAIRKDRPDLKRELDKAMEEINSYNPYYNEDLYRKYLSDISINFYLNAKEIAWIQKHGTIRIGYRDNYLPFCGTNPETGKVDGLLSDIIDKANSSLNELGLHIEAFPYPQTREAIDALRNGEVDVEFPCGLSIYSAEKEDLFVTDWILESAEMAVMRKNDNFQGDAPLRAAVNANNPNYQSMIREQLPHWQLVNFNGTHDCLVGVSRNEADLLLISNYRMNVLSRDIENLNLKIVATGNIIPFAFSTLEDNPDIFSIMNRISHIMSEPEVKASLARHSQVPEKITILDFLRTNVIGSVFFFGVIICTILLLLIRSNRDHRRAEHANQAKSRFLFNMSHDIRTPMNAILGYTELIEKSHYDPEKTRDYVAKISSAGRFLLSLINNVLEMSRIESGKMELSEKPEQTKAILVDLKAIFSDKMEKKGIEFEFTDNVHTPAIYCDALKLSEIYLNLLSNAYKYTPSGGTITVIAEEIPHPTPGWTIIRGTVKDTGIGMAPDYLPHLFEDFSRERTTTDSKIKGTGLGMSIVKRLVELMNGTITVESELGKGTTIVVTIPHRIADPAQLPQPIIQEDIKTFEGKHILMAEDNELNAEIATELLQDYGFIITWVKDGQECVDRLTAEPAGTFNLILMDIQMPNMDGYAATQLIRKMSDTAKAQIPIVAMTANAFEEDRKAAFAAGMNAHVTKPIDMPVLLKTLDSII